MIYDVKSADGCTPTVILRRYSMRGGSISMSERAQT